MISDLSLSIWAPSCRSWPAPPRRRRRRSGGGGGTPAWRVPAGGGDRRLDGCREVLLASVELALERHHGRPVRLVDLELGLVVALELEHFATHGADEARLKGVGGGLGGGGQECLVACRSLEPGV